MTPLQAALLLAAFLCSLVAGFLFAFAAMVLPGIRSLDDGGFIRAFQVIDGVIQGHQPRFIFVWVGSGLALVAAAGLGIGALSGAERLLIIAAALVYLLCVQLPTVTINNPLNNTLQKLDPGTMNETTRKHARQDFEPRWNRWNVFRAVCASVVSLLLAVCPENLKRFTDLTSSAIILAGGSIYDNARGDSGMSIRCAGLA